MTDPIVAAVADDQQIQKRARAFVNRMIDEAEELLENANPNMKMSILRGWLPSLLRELTKSNQDDELAELREQMRKLYEIFTGSDEQTDPTS